MALKKRPGIPSRNVESNLALNWPASSNGHYYMRMEMQAGTWEGATPDQSEIIQTSGGWKGGHTAAHSPAATGQSTSDSLFQLIHSDYRRYRAAGAKNPLSVILFTQGFWASSVFRFSHWARERLDLPGLRLIVRGLCILLQKFIEAFTGISIPAKCNIGSGFYVGHFGGIFIDADCRLGNTCNIAQGVTIGKGGRGDFWGVPALGDRVHIGANAVLLGNISIGDDAVIGPGAVVMISVPPRGVAMGNPARVIGTDGSFEMVHYDHMEEDPARKLSLEAALAGKKDPTSTSAKNG